MENFVKPTPTDIKTNLVNIYSRHPTTSFESLENLIDKSFKDLKDYILKNKIITSPFSTFINKALVFSIITNEISREKKKGDSPQKTALRSIQSFKELLNSGKNIMAIGSKDQYISVGPFQFKKDIYEKIAKKYEGLIAPHFEDAKLQDHTIAFYLLTSDNLKIFDRLFLSRSQKLNKMFEKATQKSIARFMVVLISAMHNAGYDNILKVLGEGLGDVPRYRVSKYPDGKQHPHGYWNIQLEKIDEKTLDVVVDKIIYHSKLPKVGRIMGPYVETLIALYEAYAEMFKGKNTFVAAISIKKVERVKVKK